MTLTADDPTLYVAWRSPDSRWFPVAEMQQVAGMYCLRYVHGARDAAEHGFFPFPFMEDVHQAYLSRNLFPLFENRVFPRSRRNYAALLDVLALGPDANALEVMARSGGRRITDSLEVFSRPERKEPGRYEVHFLVHGQRYWNTDPATLSTGVSLRVMHDLQNAYDPSCLAVRTESGDQPQHVLGYVPRYLSDDLLRIARDAPDLELRMVRVNLHAGPHLRYLCKASAAWPAGFEPFSQPFFKPLASMPLDLVRAA